MDEKDPFPEYRTQHFSLEVRATHERELARYDMLDNHNVVDGACAILIDHEIVAFANEYGTVTLVGGTDATPDKDALEETLEHAMAMYATATAQTRADQAARA